MSRTRPGRAPAPRRIHSCKCSCSCRRWPRGWRPRGRRAMPRTPKRWHRGQRPSSGPPHDGGLAHFHGAGRPRGQVLLLVAGGGGSASSTTAQPPYTGGGVFPLARGGCSCGRRPQHGAGAGAAPGSQPQRAPTSPAPARISAVGARGSHPGDAAGTTVAGLVVFPWQQNHGKSRK